MPICHHNHSSEWTWHIIATKKKNKISWTQTLNFFWRDFPKSPPRHSDSKIIIFIIFFTSSESILKISLWRAINSMNIEWLLHIHNSNNKMDLSIDRPNGFCFLDSVIMMTTSTAMFIFWRAIIISSKKECFTIYGGEIVANLLPSAAFIIIYFGNFFPWALGNVVRSWECIQNWYRIFFWRAGQWGFWGCSEENLCTCNKSTAYLWYDGRTSIHVSQNHN